MHGDQSLAYTQASLLTCFTVIGSLRINMSRVVSKDGDICTYELKNEAGTSPADKLMTIENDVNCH